MRGAGLTGLGGIYPRRGTSFGPCSMSARADLRRYLESRGQAWVEDETNEDLTNPRNRIRHRVLPELDLASGVAPPARRLHGRPRLSGKTVSGSMSSATDGSTPWSLGATAGLEIDVAGLLAEPRPRSGGGGLDGVATGCAES